VTAAIDKSGYCLVSRRHGARGDGGGHHIGGIMNAVGEIERGYGNDDCE